jgi:nucleoside-diphosphate-sugar epimerase
MARENRTTPLSSRILVLGAAGRLGHVAAEAFRDTGWTVASLVRPGRASRAPAGTEIVEADALDRQAVVAAARGADVILHALNPSFKRWSRRALPLTYSVIDAAEEAGATLLFPGNLYNYGSPLPAVIDERTAMHPCSRKGELRATIEQRLAEAAERGLRVIILRAGDFYGRGRGSWFDLMIASEIDRRRVSYPGPLDVVHEWAYLPDFAAAMVQLAAIRDRLGRFETFGFAGHAVTGREFTDAIGRAVGRKLDFKPMRWWLIQALSPIVPTCRQLSEIAYLWKEPHRIDGSKLAATIAEVPRTPLDAAVARALQDLGDTAEAAA